MSDEEWGKGVEGSVWERKEMGFGGKGDGLGSRGTFMAEMERNKAGERVRLEREFGGRALGW